MCQKPRNQLKKGHCCPMNFAFDSPCERGGGAVVWRLEVSLSLFVSGVRHLFLRWRAPVPPAKAWHLRVPELPWCFGEHQCFGDCLSCALAGLRPDQRAHIPAAGRGVPVPPWWHDPSPAAAQTPADGGHGFRGCPNIWVWVHWQWGCWHHPIACHFWVMHPGRWPWLRFPSLLCLAEAQTSEACG